MLQVCLSHLRIPVINLQIFKSRQHPYKNGIKNITLSDQLSIQQLSILTDVDQKELIRKINQFSKQLIEPILPFYNLSSQKETPTTRPLKVTIMGYVDHGKLLYQIENQNYQKVVLIQKPKEGIFQQDYQIILQLFKKQLTILFIIHDQYKCKNRKKYRFVVGTYTILKGQSRKIYGLSVTNGILNKKCKVRILRHLIRSCQSKTFQRRGRSH